MMSGVIEEDQIEDRTWYGMCDDVASVVGYTAVVLMMAQHSKIGPATISIDLDRFGRPTAIRGSWASCCA